MCSKYSMLLQNKKWTENQIYIAEQLLSLYLVKSIKLPETLLLPAPLLYYSHLPLTANAYIINLLHE